MDIFSLKYKEKERNTNRDSRIAAGLRFLSELSKFETSFNSPTNLRKKRKSSSSTWGAMGTLAHFETQTSALSILIFYYIFRSVWHGGGEKCFAMNLKVKK